MKLVALDTTEDACSVALCIEDECRFRFELAARRHSALILPMLHELLAEAGLSMSQLDALAVARGPGSFTGIRIAVGLAQGMALGADLPLVPVSSLQALAQGVYREHRMTRVCVALDARMGEVYWGLFALRDGLMQTVRSDAISRPEAVDVGAFANLDWAAAGSGWQHYEGRLGNGAWPKCRFEQWVHALDVAHLGIAAFQQGEGCRPAEVLPVYLRNDVAAKPKPLV